MMGEFTEKIVFNASQTVTIVPRLGYSIGLIDDLISDLKTQQQEIHCINRSLATEYNEYDKSHTKSIDLEHTIIFSLEMLTFIKKRIQSISGITSIPEILPSTIPMLRTISAQLFDKFPLYSQKLSELSVHLGSIVLDSAALTKARFDFSHSNAESAVKLNEVKLMADSKINKQYPNLDFLKDCTT